MRIRPTESQGHFKSIAKPLISKKSIKIYDSFSFVVLHEMGAGIDMPLTMTFCKWAKSHDLMWSWDATGSYYGNLVVSMATWELVWPPGDTNYRVAMLTTKLLGFGS